jgi:hypothetical protein
VEFVQVFDVERSRPQVDVALHSLMSAHVTARPLPEL